MMVCLAPISPGGMARAVAETFPSKENFAQLFYDAATYKIEPGQTLSEYCFNKLSKLNKLKLNLNDDQIVDCIISGVSNKQIQLSLRAANCKTFVDLTQYITKLPASFSEICPAPTISGTAGTNNNAENRDEKRNLVTATPGIKRIKQLNVECFSCGEVGHKRFECPSNKAGRQTTCNYCYKPGVDNYPYGGSNYNWTLQTQNRAGLNFSVPINQMSFGGPVQTAPFNLSHNSWPALRGSPSSSSWVPQQNYNRPQNNNRPNNVSNFPSSGPQRNNPPNVQNAEKSNTKVEDDELRNFSEELLKRDANNAARYISANFQGKTTSGSQEDKAPLPLLTVDNNVNQISTINKLKRLHDNYIVNVNQNEQVTSSEQQEEDDLLNEFLNTEVMEYTRKFLVEKGGISDDPNEFKRVLKEIWFTLYSRSSGRLGSSGFEHIFLGEIKNNDVSGLHNWVYFNSQEMNNNLDYLGYLKIVNLGSKGHILKLHFKFHGTDKPVDSIFIGTSPEFEMALYSTCFLLRPDRVCPLQLEGKRFIVRAYTFTYNGKKLIGSAFPEI
ncbi:hypothetical protein FQR65_LT09457 [Abscondita terminalis]|nr:hypothetical protein FQR65_LT09457 [Abscondita terminalis]